MDLFTLVAKIAMDSSEYERGIKKASGAFDTLSKGISAKTIAMGNMIAHAMEKAVNVAADLGRSAIQNAADVTAEKAQFTATFAELQGSAEKTFKEIEKSTGVFGTRLKNVGTKAFSQFKGAGLDGVDALDMMKDYTNLAADAAAYYDISLEDADARLRSFLRGNTEAGDAIGLFTSESQRNSAAMEKYGQKWQALTEAQKQMLMLDISKDIYKQSGAIGQAARESDAWTNVIGNLKEVWRQASAEIGEPILAVISPVVKNVSEWLNDPENQNTLSRFGLTIANAIHWVLNPTIPSWDEIKSGAQNMLDEIQNGLNGAINWTLGKFGLPDAEQVKADVEAWWTGQGDNAYERVKSVLTWTLGKFGAPALDAIDQWWNGEGGGEEKLVELLGWTIGEFIAPAIGDVITSTGKTIAGWASEFIGGVIDLLDWTLGELNLPTASSVINAIRNWWSGIRNNLDLWFSATFKVNKVVEENRASNVEKATEYLGEYATGWDTGYDTGIPGSAGGLYYAKNNFVTRLHEGEAVLTQRDANVWRARQDGGNSELISEIRALRQDLMSRREVMTPDGKVIGEISYEEVSQRIAQDAYGRRYRFG